MNELKDVTIKKLLNPKSPDYLVHPTNTLEKIECYGNSRMDVINKLNEELKRRGIPEVVLRDDGKFTCGLVDIIYQGIPFMKRTTIKTRTNIVWFAKRGDVYTVAVFIPRLQYKPLVVTVFKTKDSNFTYGKKLK